MNWSPRRSLSLGLFCLSTLSLSAGQGPFASQQGVTPPVPYASVNQLNGILTQLEQTSQAAQLDLAKLRVERWKTDSDSKRDTQSRADSIQRNLQGALPELIRELRAAPESLPSTFKMYRNLGALYDVFSSVVEAAGAFGSKDDFQSLGNDLSAFDRVRRSFADRMENLSGAKEEEIAHLRGELQKAQTSAPPPPAKKVVIDDTAPAKKTPKKSPVKKSTTSATPAPPASTQVQPH